MTDKKPTQVRDGTLSISIFENEGKEGTYKTYVYQKGYKDKDDKWQNTTNLNKNELLRMANLLIKAYNSD